MTVQLPDKRFHWYIAVASGSLAVAALSARQAPLPAARPQQPSAVSTTISGDQPGSAPRLAVPECLALSSEPDTIDVAKTVGRVLWDDLDFEQEFPLLPRDVLTTVAAATSMTALPFDRWRELNADGLVACSVRKVGKDVHVEVRLFDVRTRQQAYGMAYDGASTSKRQFAHQASDDIHWQERALQGVAQTKLTFNSDRAGAQIAGTVERRGVREIMVSDYDGENAVPVTNNRVLSMASVWSPDGRSIAYTSWPRNTPANIFIANIYERTGGPITDLKTENFLPAWSPDGRQIAFTSTRDGNSEIYVMNRDGTNVHRLTNNPAIDTTPTWSPTGARIAFTSDRTGTQQIWEMSNDGLDQQLLTHEARADRATWSLSPVNEIAFTSQSGANSDIKIIDMTSRAVRQLTFGDGFYESPVFAPNGRHLAFTSVRGSTQQIFTIGADGKNLRQVTRGSNNQMPNWSQGPKHP